MKDRTREAVMNLLGGTFPESIAFDLFAGTGVLGFEAVSRGASQAILFEILRSGVTEIQSNSVSLGLKGRIIVLQKDVLKWTQSMEENLAILRLADKPWVIFCCPPYAMWQDQGADLRLMIETWIARSPVGSLFAIELEVSTPTSFLPDSLTWDIRQYKPAQMAIGEKS